MAIPFVSPENLEYFKTKQDAQNDATFAKKSELQSAINTAIASVLTWKGVKENVSALPSSGNKIGDVWHVSADSGEYAWDGTEWQALGGMLQASVAWDDITGKPSTFAPSTHQHNAATTGAPGFMSAADKGKLDSIQVEGGEVVVDITVDSALSATSTNPVQNKVVKAALDGKAAASHTHNYAGASSAGGAATSANKLNVTQLSNQDLNDYRTPGTMYQAGGGNACANKPSGIDNFGMIVMQTANGWHTQLLYGSDDRMYTRRWNGSAWTAWSRVYTTTAKPTASEIGAAASSHSHSAANITIGTLPVARGGTGLTAAPSVLVNLGSTAAAGIFAASPRPGVTGTLPIANGGTGVTSDDALRQKVLNFPSNADLLEYLGL